MNPIKAIQLPAPMAFGVRSKVRRLAGTTSTGLYTGNMEPLLRQVLADPIVLRLMASDHVPMTDLVLMLTKIRASVAARADISSGKS